jgi:hypothetical protein
LAYDCCEMADFKAAGGSVTEIGSRLEVSKLRMGKD